MFQPFNFQVVLIFLSQLFILVLVKDINTQPPQPQIPLSSPSSDMIPPQINTQPSPDAQFKKTGYKSKLTKIFLITGILSLLATTIFGYLIYHNSKKTVNVEKEASLKKTTPTPKSIPADWKVSKCRDGYEISYPPEFTPHRSIFSKSLCPTQYGCSGDEEPISMYTCDQKTSDNRSCRIKSEKELTINGINVRYLKTELISGNGETKNFLTYEYSGNDRYYCLSLNLDYHPYDPRQDLDFYKDTEWDEMTDEYNKAQNNTNNTPIPQIDIKDIFHKMAQTFILTTPEPIPASELETCLGDVIQNMDDFLDNPDDIQYKIKENSCYRKYKEEGMTDCFKLYPNDPEKEWDCNNLHNAKLTIM